MGTTSPLPQSSPSYAYNTVTCHQTECFKMTIFKPHYTNENWMMKILPLKVFLLDICSAYLVPHLFPPYNDMLWGREICCEKPIKSYWKVTGESQVNFIYIAQYHKSHICRKGLYSLCRIQHTLSLDLHSDEEKKTQPNESSYEGQKWKKPGRNTRWWLYRINWNSKITVWTIRMTILVIDQKIYEGCGFVKQLPGADKHKTVTQPFFLRIL